MLDLPQLGFLEYFILESCSKRISVGHKRTVAFQMPKLSSFSQREKTHACQNTQMHMYVMGLQKKKLNLWTWAKQMYFPIPSLLPNHLRVDLKIYKSIGQKQAFSMDNMSWKQLNQGRLVSSWKKSSNRKHKAYWLLTDANNPESTTFLIFLLLSDTKCRQQSEMITRGCERHT